MQLNINNCVFAEEICDQLLKMEFQFVIIQLVCICDLGIYQ